MKEYRVDYIKYLGFGGRISVFFNTIEEAVKYAMPRQGIIYTKFDGMWVKA